MSGFSGAFIALEQVSVTSISRAADMLSGISQCRTTAELYEYIKDDPNRKLGHRDAALLGIFREFYRWSRDKVSDSGKDGYEVFRS